MSRVTTKHENCIANHFNIEYIQKFVLAFLQFSYFIVIATILFKFAFFVKWTQITIKTRNLYSFTRKFIRTRKKRIRIRISKYESLDSQWNIFRCDIQVTYIVFITQILQPVRVRYSTAIAEQKTWKFCVPKSSTDSLRINSFAFDILLEEC